MKDSKSVVKVEHLEIINKIIQSGERVEIIPTKDGIKIFKIERREVKM